MRTCEVLLEPRTQRSVRIARPALARRDLGAIARRFAALASILGCLTACSPAVREAVRYSGSEHTPEVSAARIMRVRSLPLGYELIGRLETSCRAWAPGTPLKDEWLADVDCSERRLRGVLYEKAASVGGELVVGERCGTTRRSAAGGDRRGRSSCRARVARRSQQARSLEPPRRGHPSAGQTQLAATAGEAAVLDEPTGGEAWRIRASYYPTSGVRTPPEGARNRASDVHELSDLPPSHLRLGTVETRCELGCSEDAMRASLRVVAGRVGASDVVGIRCVPQDSAWRCVGTLASPRIGL